MAGQPLIKGSWQTGVARTVFNPADPSDQVGSVIDAEAPQAIHALETALSAFPDWCATPVSQRAALLDAIADQYEAHAPELMALLCREAGKTRLDGVSEVREAVDFLRYYAAEARAQCGDGQREGLGVFVCISPWNFPLAIFTGQIAAALVAGNCVIAKPAEQTPLIAARAVALMQAAGLPAAVLALLPGEGGVVGAALTRDPRIAGVCFTGSTDTAILIDRAMAAAGNARAPLIAETGGLNAMIVDSTALPEAAVRDIVNSAFQSAGQRCSALRALFIQTDIKDKVLTMLEGATRELSIGNPWEPYTDVGPVIDPASKRMITDHCAAFAAQGRVLFSHPATLAVDSLFVAPTAILLDNFRELEREIFGPVLHVIPFRAEQLDEVLETLNASGYGLTLGIHSRLDERVQSLCERARVGNIYVNRNQIGAVVGVQPFGGEGLSGTGPKAGGPYYLGRFTQKCLKTLTPTPLPEVEGLRKLGSYSPSTSGRGGWGVRVFDHLPRAHILTTALATLPPELAARGQAALTDILPHFKPLDALRGPTGESNRLTLHGRGIALCLGGGQQAEQAMLVQAVYALMAGNALRLPAGGMADVLLPALQQAGVPAAWLGVVDASDPLALVSGFPDLALVALEGDSGAVSGVRQALAGRAGMRVAFVSVQEGIGRFCCERVVSIDTTASGGNASLLTLAEG